MKPQFYSTSEARKQLSSLVNQVKYQKKKFAIGRHGKTEAYLISCKNDEHTLMQAVNHEALLTKFIYDALNVLAEKYKLSLIILFGSYAKGIPKPTSDLDIAIMSDIKLNLDNEQKLYEALVKIFQREDIDLVNLKTAYNVLLEYEILTNGKILYQKSREFFINQRTKAYFNYQDFKNYFNQQKKALLNKLDNLIY